jgi:hypothetical protein
MIPRLPSGERLIADVEAWLNAEYPDAVRSIRTATDADGGALLTVDLHPAAPPVVLGANDAGQVTAAAETAGVGPGYHTFACRVLERLGEEIEIDWTSAAHTEGADAINDDDRAGGHVFVTTDPSTATRAEVETVQLAALRATLTSALEDRRRGATGLHFGTPAGVRYSVDGAIATALGPLDDAWLGQAVRDPRVAIEIWPWWLDATNARYLLNRALCLLWTEVRWRPPAIEEEMAVADEALGLLRRAYPLESSLPFPWRAWQDLMFLRGAEDPMARLVAERAASSKAEAEPIGYRRKPVTIIHEGWALVVPGSFAERRTSEEWFGGETGRRITLAGVETGRDGRPMSAEAFLAEVAGHLGSEVMTHAGPAGLTGRARLDVDSSSGVQVGVLDGYSAITGRGAAIRIEFDDPDDWQWAIDMWRSLLPV